MQSYCILDDIRSIINIINTFYVLRESWCFCNWPLCHERLTKDRPTSVKNFLVLAGPWGDRTLGPGEYGVRKTGAGRCLGDALTHFVAETS